MSCVSTLPCSTNQSSSLNSSINFRVSTDTDTSVETTANRGDADAVLAREAGVPFQPPLGGASGVDPIAEWLSLMEVV